MANKTTNFDWYFSDLTKNSKLERLDCAMHSARTGVEPRDHSCEGDCGKCRLTSLKWLQQEHVSTLLKDEGKHLLCETVKLYGDPDEFYICRKLGRQIGEYKLLIYKVGMDIMIYYTSNERLYEMFEKLEVNHEYEVSALLDRFRG